MKKNEPWGNISKHVAGESNRVQESELNEWINSDSSNQQVFDRILEVWNYNPEPVYNNQNIYRNFKNRVEKYNHASQSRNLLSYALRIAAILFLVVSITVLVKSFLISDIGTEIVYQEIAVPKGNRSSLLLPDGSKVWLSNNSRIKYPNSFSSKTRDVFLNGEAYFEVAHNKNKPFIVNIGQDRIKVLGTKFSVSAYPEDEEVKADLLTGKIQFEVFDSSKSNFKSFIVKPGQSLAFNKTTRVIRKSSIPDDFYDYWQKGVYTFKDESLESLATKIRRIYNVEIVFEEDYLRTKRYSGSFSVNDNIFTFIEAIKQTSVEPLNYRLSGNTLYLNRN